MNNRVAIVILNYKNWQDTIECLETVVNITYHPFRVIIVDNDSKNDSLVHIKNWLIGYSHECLMLTREQSENGEFKDDEIVLIQSDSNRGYAAGNNIGIRWAIRARDEYILILNNDIIVKEYFLDPLVSFLDTNPSTALVSPKIVDLHGNIDRNCARRRLRIGDFFFQIGLYKRFFPNNHWHRRHFYIGEYDFDKTKQVDVISGACMLVRTELFEMIDLLDEGTFLYLEEFILQDKIHILNKSTYIVPESQVIHKRGKSTNHKPSSLIMKIFLESLYYYLRAYRNYPAWIIHLVIFYNRLDYWLVLLKYHLVKGIKG